MKHFDKHSKSIKALLDVTEAMLHAMEKHDVDPETVANRPEFFFREIFGRELGAPGAEFSIAAINCHENAISR